MARPKCQCKCGCTHRPAKGNRWHCDSCGKMCCQTCIDRVGSECHFCKSTGENEMNIAEDTDAPQLRRPTRIRGWTRNQNSLRQSSDPRSVETIDGDSMNAPQQPKLQPRHELDRAQANIFGEERAENVCAICEETWTGEECKGQAVPICPLPGCRGAANELYF